ncbi:MAG TPA: hypothetical protein VKC11_00665 [Steroidobacteraceae bacterium]|nr:hypothetical protein [Steroidobacteraceae bacterium]
MSDDNQARAHLDAAARHAAKAAEHRLAASEYRKDTPAHAQAEWQTVSEQDRRLRRKGIHTSDDPADIAEWTAHLVRHKAALSALGEREP